MKRNSKNSASSSKKPVRKPPEEHSETCLQKHCKQWLDKSGIWNRLLIFHVPNERKGAIGAGVHFKQMGVRPGVADWLAFPITGRKMAIELKDVKGGQRSTQEAFQRDWEAVGGAYCICRTLEEFQGVVNALMLFN